MQILNVKNLTVFYGSDKVLDNVSFSLDKGDALAVIGPNGSGKTTLFRSIIGAVPFEGEIVKDPRIRIGYVPQKIDLDRNLPLTVKEFFLLKIENGSKRIYEMEEVLDLVKLPKQFLRKRLAELSSGEFQRVLIAWAVIDYPDLLLFDEPTASIDVAGQETIYDLLHRLQDVRQLTLILISHDLSVVYNYANKVLCLNHRRICFGEPKEVLTAAELAKLYGGSNKHYSHNA